LMSLSIPSKSAPPPVNTKPFSEISALSSGGVCSSATLTALTILSKGSL
jgi:hypothetical protein